MPHPSTGPIPTGRIRILRGAPTAEEVAALVAVLAAATGPEAPVAEVIRPAWWLPAWARPGLRPRGVPA